MQNKKFILSLIGIIVLIVGFFLSITYISQNNNQSLSEIERDGYTIKFPSHLVVQTIDNISTGESEETHLYFNDLSEEKLAENKVVQIELLEIKTKNSELAQKDYRSLMAVYEDFPQEINYQVDNPSIEVEGFEVVGYRSEQYDQEMYMYGTVNEDRLILLINRGVEDSSDFKDLMDEIDREEGFPESTISKEESFDLILNDPDVKEEMKATPNLVLKFDRQDTLNSHYVYQLYENVEDNGQPSHTATANWYYVDMITSEVSAEF